MKSLTTFFILGLAISSSCTPSANRRKHNNINHPQSFNGNNDTLMQDSSKIVLDYSQNDNMRGFDPASEDDMEDNGMSRYVENNDKKGWD